VTGRKPRKLPVLKIIFVAKVILEAGHFGPDIAPNLRFHFVGLRLPRWAKSSVFGRICWFWAGHVPAFWQMQNYLSCKGNF
jgi:hypothetical protein